MSCSEGTAVPQIDRAAFYDPLERLTVPGSAVSVALMMTLCSSVEVAKDFGLRAKNILGRP